ncbi:T9SS type B sorting domain-containing protein [Flavobacterium sp. N2820]|uniref:T9SS type B sorting domain-containing protein n=1 Tax=Flavobacterium sp. N2820 TaxID=2986834 RepID=UPI0022247F99|nr:T9SS type B sorting domain-containing protein [Flavobacterium sp. N2820]
MKKKLLILVFFTIFGKNYSQTYTMQNGTFNTCSGIFYDSGGLSGDYLSNESFTMTFCPSSPGTYVQFDFSTWDVEGEPFDFMTFYEGINTSGTVIGTYGSTSPIANGCGTITNYIASSHPSGCITVTFVSDTSVQMGGWAATISCTTVAGGDLIQTITPPANSVCSGSDPFCADAGPLEFPNVSNSDCVPDAPAVIVSNTCLFSAPNPAWYYLEIDQAGPLNLQISQTTGPGGTGATLDVDYALWGPFSSASAACADFTLGDCTADHACTGTVIDCSYSISATETASIPNAQVGEVYMVLITNYDGAAGYITMTQTNAGVGGAGSTDCTIVCPVAIGTNPSCNSSDGIITIEGLDAATSYNVTYFDDGTPIAITLISDASGNIMITGLNAGNYTDIVTNFPGCTTFTSNVTLTSNGTPATLTSITNNSPICEPDNAIFNLTGTPNSIVAYTINSGISQTVTIDSAGNATVTVPLVTTSTTLTTTSISSLGTPITGNGLSASGGNTPVNSTGTISTIGTPATAANCAFVNNANTTLTITLQDIVPAGTPIIISLARDNNAGDVTIASGGASTTFNVGPNDILQQITLTTITSTNTVIITRTAGIVWVDGVQYSISSPGCTVAISNSSTVIVNSQPNAGTNGTLSICDSSVTAIDLFSLISGEQSGGTWSQTSGSGGTFDAVLGTFTPAVGATSSSFTYTLPGTAPCSNVTSLATINIIPESNAGLDGVINVCSSTASAIHLDDIITGEQTGGVWNQTSGLGGTFNPMAGIFTPSVGSTSATFTYTVPGVFPCPDDVSIATVNVSAPVNAGTDGTLSICDSSTTAIDLFSLISGEQSGGTWSQTSGSGGTFDAVLGTFTPAAGATSSTFTYTLAGTAPCVNATSLATINISPQPNAGTDGTLSICDSSTTTIDLFSLISGEQSGGTWTQTSGSGGTFDAVLGTFTPAAGATSSTFTYTLAGTAPCVNATSLATINISPQPNAGTDGTLSICDSSTTTIDLFSLISGEQSGGTWTQTSGSGGTFDAVLGTFTPAAGATSSTFTYTLAGTAPCVNATSLATINISPQPNAGTDGTLSICDSSTTAIDLFSLISGEQSGGTWSQTSGSGGTFDAVLGTFTPAAGATSSTFTYTLAGTAPCVNATSLATINISPQPNAGTDGTLSICDSSTTTIDLFSLISGEQSGGTWTQTSGSGGTFDAVLGTFTPAAGATSSTFTYTLAGTAPCVNATSLATINISPQPNAGTDGTLSICDSSTTTIDLFSLISGEQSGGTWTQTSGSGGTFDAVLGTFTPAAGATSSTFTYTLAGTAPCVNATSLATINISPQPNAGTDGTLSICDSSTTAIDLFSLISGEQSGGTWSQTSGSGGTFDAVLGTFTPAAGATSSTFTYTLAGTAPCVNATSLATINISPQPNAGTDGTLSICDSSTTAIDLFSLISGEQSGGTWSQTSGSGGTFDAVLGTFTPAAGATSSAFTYTLAGTAPCVNATSLATINISPQPNAGTDGTLSICDSSVTAIDLFSLISGEQSGGTWSQTSGSGGTFDAVLGTFTPAAGATSSTFTYTLAGTAPCVNATSLATINISPQPNAGTDGTLSICDSSVTAIDLFSLISGEQSGGTWSQTSGSGGTFDAVLGTFTPAAGATSSTFTYTLAGTAPCVNATSLATINIDQNPTASINYSSAQYCISNSTANAILTGTGSYENGVFSSLPTGLSIDINTGNIDLNNSLPGTYTVTYIIPTFGSCLSNSVNTSVTISPRPVVTATVLPSTGVLCSGDVVDIQLSSNVPGAIFSWTSSSATVTGHSSSVVGSTDTFINQTLVLNSGITGTGEVVYGIVAEANGCVGETVFVTISVNPIPDVTVTGDGQTICSGETTNISFEGTVNNTVFTWVVQSSTGVSGASNGSGSSIAQVLETTGLSQGVVVYQVTPSLNGCVGASATITVYVNPIPELFGSPNHPELCSGVGSTFINFSTFNANTIFTWTVNQVGVTGATADTSTGSTLLIEQVLETTGNTQGYVDYVITPTLNGCSGTSVTVRIYVNPLPQPVLADGTICVDAAGVTFQTYLLDTGLDASMYDFVWYIDGVAQANSDAATFTASVVGVYSVIATNSVTNCVSEEEFAAVTATTPADSFTTLVTDAFSDNATITVTVSGGSGTLLYQLDEGSFQSSNVFTGVSAGEHTVTVIDSEGCTFITQNVTVIDYPKYFTPNGDGHNDTWNIVGMNQADAKLYIFDRYGKLIKQLSATDTSNGWDGTYNGQQLPSTDYWFTLDYTENGAAKQFKAHFSMKR